MADAVTDLLSWRARVRDVHHLKEVFKEDDGRVSAVEQAVLAMAEEINERKLREAAMLAELVELGGRLHRIERALSEFAAEAAAEQRKRGAA